MHTRGRLREFLWLYQHEILFVIHFQSKLANLLASSVGGSVLTAGQRRLCLLSDPSFWRRRRLKYIFFLISPPPHPPRISGHTLNLRTAGLIWLAGRYNSVQVVIDFYQCHHPSAPCFPVPLKLAKWLRSCCTILKMKFSLNENISPDVMRGLEQ